MSIGTTRDALLRDRGGRAHDRLRSLGKCLVKIAIWSNAPWLPTGYGEQCDILSKQLKAAGHDVVVLANAGFQGGAITWEGIEVYGSGWAGVLGEDGLERWIPTVKPDLLITLSDLWPMNVELWRDIAKLTQVVCWTPIDRTPVIPANQRFILEVKPMILPMSKWGEGLLRRACADWDDVKVLDYIPHSIDTDLFSPLPEDEKPYSGVTTGITDWPERERLGIGPNRTVFGMVAMNSGANPCRKSFPAVMLAFSRWIQDFSEESEYRPLLYLHTELNAIGGVDLLTLQKTLGIRDEDLRATPKEVFRGGLSSEDLVSLYRCFDVLVAPSLGEGFGIPVIEAQSCGIPVIVNDFSAQPELVGSGVVVGGTPWWDAHMGGFFQEPHPGELMKAYETYFARLPTEKWDQEAEARDFALRFDNKVVFKRFWAPLLDWLSDHCPGYDA